MANLLKIVGIGASAGGLEAIEALFKFLPRRSGMAFVVVQHLSPHFKSLMAELLKKYTQMPIVVVNEECEIEKDTIYLIPPKKDIVVKDGFVIPCQRDPEVKLNFPIDVFFHSIGREYGDRSIGVVLSGTGTDGSRGLKTIKEAGGIVLIEDPLSAKFDGMPNAAIQLGIQDAILPPGEIGELLSRIAKKSVEIKISSTLSIDEQSLFEVNEIIDRLKAKSGIDFNLYRLPTILRRIENRMQLNTVSNLKDYIDYLDTNELEHKALVKDLLIGVTNFFRDKKAFEALEKQVIPRIFENVPKGESIRVWCLACSSGEEAYSLAYLFQKHKRAINSSHPIVIFASDLDAAAIKFAGEGVYSQNDVKDLSNEVLSELFINRQEYYYVKKEYREMIVFAKHNALKDPPFINVSLLTCRNFLIYIKTDVQNNLINNFLFALNQYGFLFLGKSESINKLSDHFVEISEENIFQKIKSSKPHIARLGSESKMKLLDGAKQDKEIMREVYLSTKPTTALSRDNEFTDILVRDFGPTCIFVNNDFDVLYMNGDVDLLLLFPQRTTERFNLLNMTDEEGSLVFRNGVRKALDDNQSITYSDIKFTKRSNEYKIDVRFAPYYFSDLEAKLILIEFVNIKDNSSDSSSYLTEDDYLKDRVRTLEVELKNAQLENRSLKELIATNSEELHASNEELLSSNEELQSTNEELQSVNEELFTVNTELQEKIEEVKSANTDITNLLDCTDIGIIFLDANLSIRRFTSTLKLHFNLAEEDYGRNIAHFSSNILNSNFKEICLTVLSDGGSHVSEIENVNGHIYMMKVLPYRSLNGAIEGLVISFVDVTNLKEAEQRTKHSEERFKLAIEGARDGIWDWVDMNSKEEWWSPQFYRLINYAPEELPANLDNYYDLLHPDDLEETQRRIQDYIEDANQPFDTKYRLMVKEQGYRWFRAKAILQRDEAGKPLRMVGSISDIHDEYLYQAKIEDNEKILNAIVEGTMAGYWDWKIQEDYEYMSDSFKHMFGYEPDEIPNTPEWWQSNIHEDDLPKVLESFNEHVASKGQKEFNNLVRYRHKDGSLVWVYNRGNVVSWDADGKPLRMVGSHLEVTKLIQAEEVLMAKTNELEKINKELEQFAYIATHDLRSPVLNLKALLKIFRSSGLINEQNESLVSRIESSLTGLNDTLHDLIDITNLRKNTEENIHLILLKDAFLEQMRSINERYHYEPEVRFNLLVSYIKYLPGHITSIFYNLYSNAIKYRKDDELLIVEISTRKEEGYIVIEVKDNGKGFNMQNIDKVFGMFQRLDLSTEGKGVGLYVIKSLVETKSGHILTSSQEGVGTSFQVYLKEPEGQLFLDKLKD